MCCNFSTLPDAPRGDGPEDLELRIQLVQGQCDAPATFQPEPPAISDLLSQRLKLF